MADIEEAYDYYGDYYNGSMYDMNSTGMMEYEYHDYFYHGFAFERPIYLVIWEVLVIVTTVFNILIIVVLLGKGMVNSTNMILISIAVSDSLTGLVTLPTYIYVYQQFTSGRGMSYDYYMLSKEWCQAFMISKFFLSRSFHTVSIWLTVFLGFQRFISVWFPFKAQDIFTKVKTFVSIVMVFVLSPLLHVYHLDNEKAIHGICSWVLEEGCKGGCAYLWLTLILMHFVPCCLLIVFTTLMLVRLQGSAAKMREMAMVSNSETSKRRAEENRRISFIVISVVVVFLIPEIPYGIYQFVTVIRRHAGQQVLPLKTNRTFDCVYEILLVLSFHANFWVYTLMNKRFRDGLKRTFSPVNKRLYMLIGKRHSVATESSMGDKTQYTDAHSKSAMEMEHLNAH